MKRDEIRAETDKHLAAIGLKRGQWQWQPQLAQLILLVGDEFKTIKLRSGMSRRALSYQLGYIAGLAHAAGIRPIEAAAAKKQLKNGVDHAHA